MLQRILAVAGVIFISIASPMLSAAEIGHQAPNYQLTSIDTDKRYDFQQYIGKVIYVDFWASWCPPCAKSFPFLNEMHSDFKGRGLEIMVVNLDEQLADAKLFLTKYPSDFTVVSDLSKQCAKDFAVEGMPSSYLIDRKGVIRHVHLGFRTEDVHDLRVIVEQLLAEK